MDKPQKPYAELNKPNTKDLFPFIWNLPERLSLWRQKEISSCLELKVEVDIEN